MNFNLTLFSQIIKFLNREHFSTIVRKYSTDKYSKGVNSWTHFVSMLFCHLAKANSLREIIGGMLSMEGNLFHIGVKDKVPRKSTLSYINEHRNWELFRDYYISLHKIFVNETGIKSKKFRIKRKIYLLDSTLISLCSKIYDWAHYTRKKGAIKLHMLLDYDGLLPSYMYLSDGKMSDMKAAKEISIPKTSVVVADRGYLDFSLLWTWESNEATFVVRCKENVNFIGYEEYDLPDGKSQNILKDEKVLLQELETRKKYPKKLRMVTVYDEKKNSNVYLLTNNFTWTAETISELYKQRWQIEIFFRDIKSLFKIKSFVGTSVNAVMIQIWTAMITMLILKYLKHKSKYNWSLSNLVAFIRMNLLVKISLEQWLNTPFKPWEELQTESNMQLKLFP
jgi:hypothetical protein